MKSLLSAASVKFPYTIVFEFLILGSLVGLIILEFAFSYFNWNLTILELALLAGILCLAVAVITVSIDLAIYFFKKRRPN